MELQDLKSYTHIEKPIQCLSHPTEELKLFCEQCGLPVCQECVVGEHWQHPSNFIGNVIRKHENSIQELLKVTERHVGTLEGACSQIEGVSSALSNHVELITQEIRSFADGYVKAIEEHRDGLLKYLEELKVQRENQLHLQKAQLLQLCLDMNTGVEFTKHLLANGSDLEILLTKQVVENRLKKLNNMDYNTHPVANVRIHFSPQEKAGLYHGYEIFGAILDKAADPAKCVLQGEGKEIICICRFFVLISRIKDTIYFYMSNAGKGKLLYGRGRERKSSCVFHAQVSGSTTMGPLYPWNPTDAQFLGCSSPHMSH